jgi:hypothetical protein
MFFKFTSRKVVEAQARDAALQFYLSCQRSGKKFSPTSKANEKAVQGVMDEVFAKVKVFRVEQRLGIFNRAHFAKIFQDELVKQGMGSELVSKVTTALVTVALSGK